MKNLKSKGTQKGAYFLYLQKYLTLIVTYNHGHP